MMPPTTMPGGTLGKQMLAPLMGFVLGRVTSPLWQGVEG